MGSAGGRSSLKSRGVAACRCRKRRLNCRRRLRCRRRAIDADRMPRCPRCRSKRDCRNRASGVDDGRSPSLVEPPATDQSRCGDELLVHRSGDVVIRARVVPDACFIEDTMEDTSRLHARTAVCAHRCRERNSLNTSRDRCDRSDEQTGIEHSIEIEAPGRAVECRCRVMPHRGADRDDRSSGNRMVGSASSVLDVGDQRAGRAADAEDVVEGAAEGEVASADQRNHSVEAVSVRRTRHTHTRREPGARSCSLEPGFEGKCCGSETRRRINVERHMLARAVELQCRASQRMR